MESGHKKTLFVLSGGGMPGLDIHVGIWRALEDAGIEATEIAGTSAGAIIGAYMAAGWSAESAEDYIKRHTDAMIRHERRFWQLRLPWIESIHDNDHIRIVLEGSLPLYWSKMRKPISIWATQKLTGCKVNVARPEMASSPVDAVLASMAICGLFPAVRLNDGREYIDGGVRFNLPLVPYAGFDRVFLLIGKPRPQDYEGTGVISNLIRNFNISMLDQVLDVLETVQGNPRVTVIWPDVPGTTSMLRFNHDLIEAAYIQTTNQLTREAT